tara:strand:+ start:8083 stop:8598 length:516 start_codon:yes stop_codon:yes gene_type:complete
MTVSNVVKVRRDGQITLSDNGGANTLVVDYEGDGSFSFDNGAGQAERTVIMDRGSIVGLRKANDVVGSLSFAINMRAFTNTAVAPAVLTIPDVLNKAGAAAAWVSTGGSGFEQYLLDVKITIEGTDHGDSHDHTATFSKVLLTWDFSEGDPNVINISGEVYGGQPVYTGQQ